MGIFVNIICGIGEIDIIMEIYLEYGVIISILTVSGIIMSINMTTKVCRHMVTYPLPISRNLLKRYSNNIEGSNWGVVMGEREREEYGNQLARRGFNVLFIYNSKGKNIHMDMDIDMDRDINEVEVLIHKLGIVYKDRIFGMVDMSKVDTTLDAVNRVNIYKNMILGEIGEGILSLIVLNLDIYPGDIYIPNTPNTSEQILLHSYNKFSTQVLILQSALQLIQPNRKSGILLKIPYYVKDMNYRKHPVYEGAQHFFRIMILQLALEITKLDVLIVNGGRSHDVSWEFNRLGCLWGRVEVYPGRSTFSILFNSLY